MSKLTISGRPPMANRCNDDFSIIDASDGWFQLTTKARWLHQGGKTGSLQKDESWFYGTYDECCRFMAEHADKPSDTTTEPGETGDIERLIVDHGPRNDLLAKLQADCERLRTALIAAHATISKIDYLLGDPNEMGHSQYDVDCDDERVVRAVTESLGFCRKCKMSDKTNELGEAWLELPNSPGCWFELFPTGIIEERWCFFGDNDNWCYLSRGQGEHGTACTCQSGRWVRAVPASELATLKADCERWSRLCAKQADELAAVKAERDTFKFQRDVFEASVREMNNYCEELKEAYCHRAHAELVSQVATLQYAIASGCERVAELEDRLAEVERYDAQLSDCETELEKLPLSSGCNGHLQVAGHIRNILDALEAAEARVKWQPMESAPKDGSRVLVFDEQPLVAHFHYARRDWETDVGDSVMPVAWQPLPTTPPADGAQSG